MSKLSAWIKGDQNGLSQKFAISSIDPILSDDDSKKALVKKEKALSDIDKGLTKIFSKDPEKKQELSKIIGIPETELIEYYLGNVRKYGLKIKEHFDSYIKLFVFIPEDVGLRKEFEAYVANNYPKYLDKYKDSVVILFSQDSSEILSIFNKSKSSYEFINKQGATGGRNASFNKENPDRLKGRQIEGIIDVFKQELDSRFNKSKYISGYNVRNGQVISRMSGFYRGQQSAVAILKEVYRIKQANKDKDTKLPYDLEIESIASGIVLRKKEERMYTVKDNDDMFLVGQAMSSQIWKMHKNKKPNERNEGITRSKDSVLKKIRTLKNLNQLLQDSKFSNIMGKYLFLKGKDSSNGPVGAFSVFMKNLDAEDRLKLIIGLFYNNNNNKGEENED